MLDRVAQTRTPVTITKRGKPVATLVPYTPPRRQPVRLAGSILEEHGDPFGTNEDWDADSQAATAISRVVQNEDTVWISTISAWEVAKKVEKGQLVLDRPLREWMQHATTVPGLFLAEISAAILLDSCELPQPFHGDPADQMIVASARHPQAPLVTKDRKLRSYRHVPTVW